MGLDMYLQKKIYIGANYEHNNVKGVIELTKGKDNTPIKINLSKVSEIVEEVAYWRKANQIHKWFVDNIQDGEDDRKEYYVSQEKLKELVELCKTVLKTAKTVDGQVLTGETWDAEGHHYHYKEGAVVINQDEIAELLPTESGFFFGGTDYDEYYIHDIVNTIEQLEPLLEDKEGSYYYSSSW